MRRLIRKIAVSATTYIASFRVEGRRFKTAVSSHLPPLRAGKIYCGGGITTVQVDEIDGLDTRNESAINPSAVLADGARDELAGISGSFSGYWGGGWNGASIRSVIDGIKYADESALNPAATLADGARLGLGSVSSPVRGYFAGGEDSVTPTFTAAIDAFHFLDESAVNPAATLADGARQSFASGGSFVNGYFFNGITTGAPLNVIDGIKYADESALNPAATLGTARSGAAACVSLAKAYIAGGFDVAIATLASIEAFGFAGEAISTLAATLADGARGFLAAGQGVIHGYWLGGFTSARVDTIDGLNFGDESARNPAATLATARNYLSACSSGSIK